MHISFYDIILYDYSSYYTTGSVSESEFDAEGQLTSAVNYVSSEDSAIIYRTSGHGETTFSTTAMLAKQLKQSAIGPASSTGWI